MIFKASPDIAMFLSGSDGTKDTDVARMAGWYARASALADARYWCYAIIGHGTPSTIAEIHISQAIQNIELAYRTYGKKRVLLVLSCALGYGSARTIATRLSANVIAARTTITISDTGDISLKPETEAIKIGEINMPPRSDWIFVKADGSMTLSSLKSLSLGSAGEFFDL
ncbi:MAG: hypothetical protein AAFN77_09200 [Planctomycetota bacterium]